MTRDKGMPWLRWMTEFVLIVGSVFLGVYLEGASQRGAERAAARVALSQLRGELQGDLGDFDRIIAKQDSLHVDYTNLLRWLAAERPYPTDSLASALFRLTTENPTLFFRRASWTTMVAGNQLADLDAPDLVLQLGQLYENLYARIDYNSKFYDESLWGVLGSPAIRWHSLRSDPLSQDAAEVERLAASLEWVHLAWNVWYRDLLIVNRADALAALATVDEYLAAHGEPEAAP